MNQAYVARATECFSQLFTEICYKTIYSTNTGQLKAPYFTSPQLYSYGKKGTNCSQNMQWGLNFCVYKYVFLMIPVNKTALSRKLQAYSSQLRIQRKKNAAPTSMVKRKKASKSISPQTLNVHSVVLHKVQN